MERVLYIAAAVALAAPMAARLLPRMRGVLDHFAWPTLAIALQLAALVVGTVREGHLPLDTFQHGLGALSLWVVCGWLYFRRRERMDMLAGALLALALILLLVGQLAPSPGYTAGAELNSIWFPLHVLLMLTGFLGFALSCLISSMYLVLRRRLKQRRLQGIGRLPSLDTLDRLNLQAMALGFVALTAGMVVGGLWARARPEGELGPDVTTYATLGVWLWYAAGLYVRLGAGWRGRLAAVFGVIGFVGLAILFGVAVVILRGWHGFGS